MKLVPCGVPEHLSAAWAELGIGLIKGTAVTAPSIARTIPAIHLKTLLKKPGFSFFERRVMAILQA
jgi:hypothetical protein